MPLRATDVLKRLPIGVKIFIAPVVITVLMLALLLASNVALNRQQDAFAQVVDGSLATSSVTHKLLAAVSELQSEVLRYVQLQLFAPPDPTALDALRRGILGRYQATGQLLEGENAAQVGRDVADGIRQLLAQHLEAARKVLDPARPVDADSVSGLISRHQELQQRMTLLAGRAVTAAQAAQVRARESSDELMQQLLAGSAIAIAVAIALTLYVERTISQPMARLVALMRTIAGGNAAVRVRGTDRRDEIGEMARAVATFAAVTSELRQREQMLTEARAIAESANQYKSRFLANMSHELRTPLNAVLGFTEMLSDGIYGPMPDRARAALEKVDRNGRHLLGLINDVLDLSKIEAGQFQLALAPYSVRELVEGVAANVDPLAQAKGLALRCEVPTDLPNGTGDERRLAQVLINLVGNAIKFTDQGAVDVQVRQAGDQFDIAVRDTGPGIAAANQSRIFDEFQQVDDSSTRPKGGTGLGLAISKRIVEMHGGTITVESVPGAGATFRVRVPVQVVVTSEALA